MRKDLYESIYENQLHLWIIALRNAETCSYPERNDELMDSIEERIESLFINGATPIEFDLELEKTLHVRTKHEIELEVIYETGLTRDEALSLYKIYRTRNNNL